MRNNILYLFLVGLLSLGCNTQGQLPQGGKYIGETEKNLAFPGADGYGKYTTGSRGGKVYVVTTLADNGLGSLWQAVQKKEPKSSSLQ